MHGIFIGGGDVVVAFLADAAAPFFRGILDHILVGLVLVGDILTFVAIDTADLAMIRVDKFLVNAVCVPAPHLRSRDASTGNGCRAAGLGRTILIHLLEIGMAADTFAAGGDSFLSEQRPG